MEIWTGGGGLFISPQRGWANPFGYLHEMQFNYFKKTWLHKLLSLTKRLKSRIKMIFHNAKFSNCFFLFSGRK